MSSIIQRRFAGGEIGPDLYADSDVVKYSTGCKILRNFLIMKHGGATNRAGSVWLGEVKDSTRKIRQIPFEFNNDQTYVLEFGEFYIRFIKNDEYLTYAPVAITGIALGALTSIHEVGHSLNDGAEVYVSGVVGPTQLNGRNFKVVVIDANNYEIRYMDGTAVNSAGWTAWSSGGTTAVIYQIFTSYQQVDLATLYFVQSGDVITITHHHYPPSNLNRFGDINWTLTLASFAPRSTVTNTVAATGGVVLAGGFTQYAVTAVDAVSFEESLPAYSAQLLNGPDSTHPMTVTWAAVPSARSYVVYKNTNGIFGFIGIAGTNAFLYNFIVADSTDTAPIAKTPFIKTLKSVISGVTPGTTTKISLVGLVGSNYIEGQYISIDSIVGTTELNNGLYLVTGVILTLGVSLDFYITYLDGTPVDSSTFGAYVSGGNVYDNQNYPAVVNYIQQRLCLANTLNNTEKEWMSKTGRYTNFTTSTPSQADDEIEFNMAGKKVNAIKHILDIGKMIVLTSTGEWYFLGDGSGALSPDALNPQQASFYGSADLAPIVIGSSALFLQARQSLVRDLAFNWETQGYTGNDLTLYSPHLFENHTIVDWSYQQIPHSIVWAVRDDGVLLGLTYIREQQIFAWHRHDMRGGYVENVCCIPNGNEDVVYLTVRRVINGVTKRYVERLATRTINNQVDNIFSDCTISYDGRNADEDFTVELTGSGWTYEDELTITASSALFYSTDVGNEIHVTGPDGTLIRFRLTGYTGPTVMTGFPDKTVTVPMQAVALSTWGKALKTVHGLWHIEGETVSVVGDGFVVASPNNDKYDLITVSEGTVVLPRGYVVIHVGLPYISDLEPLNIDTPQGETVSDKYKNITRVSAYVKQTRGFFAGSQVPEEDTADLDDPINPLHGLNEYKSRYLEGYDQPVSLKTEVIDVNIEARLKLDGRVVVRQVDPLPITILSIIPTGDVIPKQRGG